MTSVDTTGLFIGGSWAPGAEGSTMPARNPATGEKLADVVAGSVQDVDRAVAAARAAWADFRTTTVFERATLCRRIAEVLHERRDDLARTIALEQGKPLHTEAYAEVDLAVEGFNEAAELVKHLEGAWIPLQDPNKRAMSFRQPRGVYAVVTPWNFPVNIPTEYLAPGIASGNAIVWVPAPSTSLCAVRLAECLQAAGVPDGVVNLVTGAGPVVGDAAVSHPGTDAVGFTGSTATGHLIASRAAGKPQLLELGGNGPTIVFADADLAKAAASLAFACFLNAGQTCAATELVLCERSVATELAQLIAREAETYRVGDPLAADTRMGPLNNEPVAAKNDRHVADAVDRGATVLTGGRRMPELGSPLFFAPTVLDDVPPDALFAREESFGPVAPVVPVDGEDEALAVAGTSGLGLSASVWTRDVARAIRVSEALRTGIVNINEHSAYWEIHVPFGGASGTGSGVGRLGGRHTILAMTDLKTVTLDLSRF
ncbi:MAG: aldehyde dehydrogenase family protein [Actinocatenispora sp.]